MNKRLLSAIILGVCFMQPQVLCLEDIKKAINEKDKKKLILLQKKEGIQRFSYLLQKHGLEAGYNAIMQETAVTPKPETKPETKPEPKPEPKPETKPAASIIDLNTQAVAQFKEIVTKLKTSAMSQDDKNTIAQAWLFDDFADAVKQLGI